LYARHILHHFAKDYTFPNLQNNRLQNCCAKAKYRQTLPLGATFSNSAISLDKFDFHSKIGQTMEVIAIQKSTLDGMKNELKALLELTENATQKYTPIFAQEQWLDNQEVCLMMNITKRTLQTYKDKGLLPYSKLNRKNYYKRSDVQALLEAGQPYNTAENGFIHE